jgi:endonuclease
LWGRLNAASIINTMAIYEKPVCQLMFDMISELAPNKAATFSWEQAVEWFKNNYPKIKEGTISCHLVRFSTNARSRIHYSVKSGEDMLFQIDRDHFRLYDPANDPVPIQADSSVVRPASTSNIGESSDEADREFAYESDLRDFLAKNLQIVEPGLELYREEDIVGIEFLVGGRFIDILAVDSKKRLVVIELKVSRGYDRVVGQILRYMAWIGKNMAEQNQPVRGIIVAREISEDLQLACSNLPTVSLYEYKLSVTLRRL